MPPRRRSDFRRSRRTQSGIPSCLKTLLLYLLLAVVSFVVGAVVLARLVRVDPSKIPDSMKDAVRKLPRPAEKPDSTGTSAQDDLIVTPILPGRRSTGDASAASSKPRPAEAKPNAVKPGPRTKKSPVKSSTQARPRTTNDGDTPVRPRKRTGDTRTADRPRSESRTTHKPSPRRAAGSHDSASGQPSPRRKSRTTVSDDASATKRNPRQTGTPAKRSNNHAASSSAERRKPSAAKRPAGNSAPSRPRVQHGESVE